MNLNQQVIEIEGLLSRTIPRNIKIDLHLGADLELIRADPSQIGQIIMNLGVNARDAMPEGGTLSVITANDQLDQDFCRRHLGAKPGRYVSLTVSDTGYGMDQETQLHIFEPFFTTKEAGKGTGLGLATVYGIVKLHTGYIICYSEPEHGTTFRIFFPAISSEREPQTKGEETLLRGGSETILLIDDDTSVRDWGTEILSSVGYEVLTATNGKEALEIYQRAKRENLPGDFGSNNAGNGWQAISDGNSRDQPQSKGASDQWFSRRQGDSLHFNNGSKSIRTETL